MPTTYATQGFTELLLVDFIGAEGDEASHLTWDGRVGANTGFRIFDQDDDGQLDATGGQPDYFEFPSYVFTGYTINSGGLEYGVFSNGTSYLVPLPVEGGGTQTVVPNDGTSNEYQTQTGTNVYLCFAAGTRLATPDGEAEIETLRIGDLLQTADGRAVPVKWIGRQTVSRLFSGSQTQPVRIRAGALGDGLPYSDLTVTAEHGMIIDGYVINASALVNGATIDFVPMDELEDRFFVYHVETENHDVIFANGAPAETFVDAVTRQNFDNYQEYLDLYGAERIVPEMDRLRISSQRLLPASLKHRLGIVDTISGIDDAIRA